MFKKYEIFNKINKIRYIMYNKLILDNKISDDGMKILFDNLKFIKSLLELLISSIILLLLKII